MPFRLISAFLFTLYSIAFLYSLISNKLDKKIANESLDILKIDEFGLDTTDRALLNLIIEKYDGGPVGIESIAAAIGEEEVTLEDVYEPYLMQIGFLARTPRGRIATPLAYKHLNIEIKN